MADEFELIERYFATPGEPGDGVWLGVGDDAAVLDVPPGRIVVDEMTLHPIPAGTGGFAFGSFAIGDALARASAAGAEPRWFTLALTLPEADETWLADLSRAVRDIERRHRVRLVGGDTTQGPGALAVSVFALLPAEPRKAGGAAGGSPRAGPEAKVNPPLSGRPAPPRSEEELLSHAKSIAGLRLDELANEHGWPVPETSSSGKGWPGQLIESALGASAASLPEPDFQLIGVELKTIPVDGRGRPRESTYVCSVPLEAGTSPSWEDSNVWRKLSRVLWVPLLCDDSRAVGERRIGSPLLWSPGPDAESALRADWEEFMELVCVGRIDEISAHFGTCLQIRPKAANARSRRWAVGATGTPVRTLPRGFYLRTSFTSEVLETGYLAMR